MALKSKLRLLMCKLDFHSFEVGKATATLENGNKVYIPYLQCKKCEKVVTIR